jgi:hypothetical protein
MTFFGEEQAMPKCTCRIVFSYNAETEEEIPCEREKDHAGAHMAGETAFIRDGVRQDRTALVSLVWWEDNNPMEA